MTSGEHHHVNALIGCFTSAWQGAPATSSKHDWQVRTIAIALKRAGTQLLTLQSFSVVVFALV